MSHAVPTAPVVIPRPPGPAARVRSQTRVGPRLGVAVVAGLLLGLAFPPYDLWMLAFPALALLAVSAHAQPARRGALLGLGFGLAFFLLLFPWLRIIGSDAWVGLSLLEAAFFAPLGAALALTSRLRLWPLAWAALWVGQEAARGRAPFGGLPWGNLAFSQSDSPLTPLVAAGGAPLLGFATALIGAMLAAAALALKARHVRTAVLVVAGATVVPLAAAAVPVPTGAGDRTASVAVVQGNVPRSGLDFEGQRRAVLDNHVTATLGLADRVAAGAVARPDLVVWPENASDIDPFRNPDAHAAITGAAAAVGVPTLVGAVVEAPDGVHVENSGIVWTGDGPGARYVKRHPVPFGEYIPYRAQLTKLVSRLEAIPRDFAKGTAPGVLQLGPARVADVICFEVAYDGVVRDAVRAGGDVIVVQTNNATYGRTGQPSQQLAISRLRAVEQGRTVLNAATSGISAIVLPDGTFVDRTQEFTQDVLLADVPLRDARTLADRVGAWPEWLLVAGGVLALLLAVASRRRHDGAGDGSPQEGQA